MARKNGFKNDSCATLTFNSRTKTVMADVAQENIKEKVNSVREVVNGKSNNEIILVLQFYEYDVEKTIQAYIEDGAKGALQEWQFSGSKPVKKKRNKKKSSTQNTNAQSLESVSSESGSAASLVVNGYVSHNPVVNGVLDHELVASDTPKIISNGPTAEPYQVPDTDTPSSYPTHQVLPTTTDTSNHFDLTLPNSTISASESGPIAMQVAADVKVTPEVTVTPEVKVIGDNKGAKEKSPSLQSQRQHHANHHHNRQRAHSGNYGHNDMRDRTTSASSTDGKTGKKAAHLGLERSAKDLHRQTVSLERLRLIFSEEVDRSYKRIKSVFDEMRTCLNAREALLVGELSSMKTAGGDTFNTRQGLAHHLKVQIDRAERMNEAELAELRVEIKHFVSDRKIDEDLAKATRFLYDDKLKEEIVGFGEVVPVKCQYIQRRGSGSSVANTVAISEPDHHLPKQTVDIPHTSVPDSDIKPGTPHLDSSQAHEMAELQRRLKHSLTLEGIPVKTYPESAPVQPERPESAPAPTSSSVKIDNDPRSVGAVRNDRYRRRNDRDRPPRAGGSQDDSRITFNQAPNGERIILIGRKTGPQGSGRPPRSWRGRGVGSRGRGGNSSVGRVSNSDNVSVGDSGPGSDTASGPTAATGKQGSKPLPQRENSGSPRRGSGRGRGPSGNRLRGGSSNPGTSRSPVAPSNNPDASRNPSTLSKTPGASRSPITSSNSTGEKKEG